MSLGFGILGFLNYSPMSGYDLAKVFDTSLEFFWHAQKSQIYLELKKLEKCGYISGNTVIQSDKPNKRIFSITEAGRSVFMDELAQGPDEEATHFKNAFLMKVFFSGNQSPAQNSAMLQQFKSDCEAYLQRLAAVPDAIQDHGGDMDEYQTLFWNFTADFGFCYIRACIDWAARCIEKLEELQ